MNDWPVRPVDPADRNGLVALWHDGWHDGHADILPAALTARRTRADFQQRLTELVPDALTAGPVGAPRALCVTQDDDLYQFYVAAAARGTALAARLLAAGEARIASAGHKTARLDVAIGNARAEHFYVKHGWQSQGPIEVMLKTTTGDFPLTIQRMIKVL